MQVLGDVFITVFGEFGADLMPWGVHKWFEQFKARGRWKGFEKAIKPHWDIVNFLSLFFIMCDGDMETAFDYSFGIGYSLEAIKFDMGDEVSHLKLLVESGL